MLRITRVETGDTVRLVLEGDLKGAWVPELERLYTEERAQAKSIIIDVRDLTGADTAGRYLLGLLEREGARFENVSALCRPLFGGRGEHMVSGGASR
jgi:ABC-type transporter Mla MlaB component